MNVCKSHDLIVSAPDRVGLLGEIAGRCKDVGVNILGVCAYRRGDTAHVVLHTSDPAQTAKLLADMSVVWQEVLVVSCETHVGILADIGRKLAEVGINILFCYGTAMDTPTAALIMDTTHNDRALEALRD